MILNYAGGLASRAKIFEFELENSDTNISKINQMFVVNNVDIPTDAISGFLISAIQLGSYDDSYYKVLNEIYWNESNDDHTLASADEGKINYFYRRYVSGEMEIAYSWTNDGYHEYSRADKTFSLNLYNSNPSSSYLQLAKGIYTLVVWW